MSVLKYDATENMSIISHLQYVKELYCTEPFWENLNIFDIKTPFRMDLEAENVAKRLENGETMARQKKKKRKLEIDNPLASEVESIQRRVSVFLAIKESSYPGQPSLADIRHNNRDLRENVKRLLDTLQTQSMPDRGQNLSSKCVEKDGVIMPPKSAFVKLDVENLNAVLNEASFDLIVMDPPWSNKHVKRVKKTGRGYEMMDNADLEKMPVDKLLNDDGLVFVWCTNKCKHRNAVSSWFSVWGVRKVATWYWVKVTKYGEMVTEFTPDKQPYEVILIGQRSGSGSALKDLKDGMVIFSVPSGIHSHKPPLTCLIETVLRDQVLQSWDMLGKLEIFGRYLLPGWLTVGNQPALLNIRIKPALIGSE